MIDLGGTSLCWSEGSRTASYESFSENSFAPHGALAIAASYGAKTGENRHSWMASYEQPVQ